MVFIQYHKAVGTISIEIIVLYLFVVDVAIFSFRNKAENMALKNIDIRPSISPHNVSAMVENNLIKNVV
jgi:hypothetical protein